MYLKQKTTFLASKAVVWIANVNVKKYVEALTLNIELDLKS